MKTSAVLFSALFVFSLLPFTRAENEIGFIEKFALAPDREAVLSQLLPGSEDFYHFHALHYQNTGQFAKLAAIMDQWAKRFPGSSRRQIIENRSALLAYKTDPQKTLQFLRNLLHIEFDHQQQVRDQKPDLPAKLDPALLSRTAFQTESLRSDDNLGQFEDEALLALLRDKIPLKASQTRDLLARLKRPDVPGLVDLIAADLKNKESRGFGEFEIHRALLPEQMDDLARRIPSLFENQNFVFTRVRKLAPGADADAEFDPAEREAWLDRVWAYAKNLSPSFNTLKAQILFQRLQHDRTRGIYDKARFIEYLKLPRQGAYVNPDFLRRADLASQMVDPNADLSAALGTSTSIRTDEGLVRDYLLRLLKDEPSWEPWAVWLRDTWLKPVFAESKIVNAVGNPEQWASLLSPAAFQALKERVDIDFALTNPPFLAPADDVSIDLFVKNAPKLIVKIYEINTLSYYLSSQRQLNTDLALDGLVANREITHDFSADELGRSPFRRAARTFKFPELKNQRGAWVIEFIGGGKSSRALVRKGQWSVLQRSGPAGDMLTVLDEARQPVKDAVVWLDGRKFTPDQESGYILVPFTQQPATKNLVLADPAGGFATLTSFDHHAEHYRLDAQIHLEREQLLARRKATILVRTALLLNDAQVSLDLLKDVKLSVTTKTLHGVITTSQVDIPALDPAREFIHTITVPDGVSYVGATLTAQVEKLATGGGKETLTQTRELEINGLDKTTRFRSDHLSRFGDGYVFELLGKNGEPIPDQQILLDFRHREFHREITVALRTDDQGRVDLGALDGIAHVKARGTSGNDDHHSEWDLERSGRTWPRDLHTRSGDIVTLPWTDEAPPSRVSLLEMRGGSFVADRSAALTVQPAALVIKGLAPGDYSLVTPRHEPVNIRVTAGEVVKNWLVSPNRELELRGAAPVNIVSITREPTALVVQLANADPFTRLHLVATRFLPEVTLLQSLGAFTRFEPAQGSPAKMPNLFAAGRAIGDEYRYILERRYAKLFPGNMLPRPGLLLNPWDIRSTDLQAQELTSMQRSAGMIGGRPASKNAPAPPSGSAILASRIAPDGPNIDFLAQSAPVLANLVPDAQGIVRVDLPSLGDRQHVQIYVEDLTSAAWRTLTLPEVPTKFQEQRLVRNLDPQKLFTEKKNASVLSIGQTLTLPDILTADLEIYDSLAGIHALFTTLSHDENLAKFAWVLQWPDLKDEDKRAKYSEFACHELNFFLSRKDPAFFQKVILPYLRNKKDRTFLDDFLLGNDLARYREPWAYDQLNMAERALLAQRLPGEAPLTARLLREAWEILPPDPDQENHLFETALLGRSLQSDPGQNSFRGEKSSRESEPLAAGVPLDPAPTPLAAAEPARSKNGQLHPAKLAMADAAEKRKDLADKPVDALLSASAGAASPMPAEEPAVFMRGQAERQRALVRPFFRALGPTHEWAENNYYQLRNTEQNADLIPINAFWRDYAAWDGKTPFISPHVPEASRNFSEMMLALAVLDLPFTAPKHVTKTDAGQFSLTAGGSLIAFHRQIKPAVLAPENSSLLVSQNFFQASERYRQEGNEEIDNYVTTEFLSGVVYGANIVVTNPTSAPQKLTALLQISRGALPVNGSQATESRPLRIEPYTTQKLEYFFYFPAPNPATEPTFAHYPVQIARDELIVGGAKPQVFKVVKQLSEVDKNSWDYLSQDGSDAEVFSFLEKTNLSRLDLAKIAWRARKSADFFRKVVGFLEAHHVDSEPVFRYALLHNDPRVIRSYLSLFGGAEDFYNRYGPWIDTPILAIDPIERRAYEHLEYSPLVNQRAHRVGAENRIPNPVLRAQYQSLLNVLAYKPSLDAVDLMSVTYYLFLQDRIEEALARFHTIAPAALPTRLQHDYFRAYAAFYEEEPAVARGLVQQYADYPVDRWRKAFAEVGAQLDEIEGKVVTRPGNGQPDREKQQGGLAATEPAFDFKVENRQIALTWKNLGAVTVNYYLMDPEFMFSASPFVTQDAGRFSIIKPTRTFEQPLPAGQDALVVPLPGEFARSNVLVEILGAGQRKAQAYHANSLKLNLAENYGQLEVRDELAGKPVSKAYVKVYARLRDGTVRYYKDGYTDLRGKFDYASLNSSESQTSPPPRPFPPANAGASLSYQMLTPAELGEVDRLAILLISEAHGAAVREVAPPRQ